MFPEWVPFFPLNKSYFQENVLGVSRPRRDEEDVHCNIFYDMQRNRSYTSEYILRFD